MVASSHRASRAHRIVALLGAALAAPLAAAHARDPLSAEEVFERAAPSIFVVESRLSDGRGSQGSAVLVAPDLLATNCHTVGIGRPVTVRRGRLSYAAEVAHRDRWNDICLLSLPAGVGAGGAPSALAAAADLRIGAPVYAIGAPRGLELSLSAGLVSQLRQGTDGASSAARTGGSTIQTTAPISPGSSGGGLFDGRGRLVGITTSQVRDGQNLNFAVSADVVLDALGQITESRDCLSSPNRRCLLRVAERWILHGEYDQAQGPPGTNLLLHLAFAHRAESEAERSEAALLAWQEVGRAGRPVVVDGHLTLLGIHTTLSLGLLHIGDRHGADAHLQTALRSLGAVSGNPCATPSLLRVVLELRGRPVMERVAREHPCASAHLPTLPTAIRRDHDLFLALFGAGRDAEARPGAEAWLRQAADRLRAHRAAWDRAANTELHDLVLAARPFAEFAAVQGPEQSALRDALRVFVTRYAALLDQHPAVLAGEDWTSLLRRELVGLLALSDQWARARQAALAERHPASRRMALGEVFRVACAAGHDAVCGPEWLSGEGRHLVAQDEFASWASSVTATHVGRLAARGELGAALDALAAIPRDAGWERNFDRGLACVATRYAEAGNLPAAVHVLAFVRRPNDRAEALLGALARDQADPRLRTASRARFDRYSLTPPC